MTTPTNVRSILRGRHDQKTISQRNDGPIELRFPRFHDERIAILKEVNRRHGSPLCKDCFGRGWQISVDNGRDKAGRPWIRRTPVPCSCVRKKGNGKSVAIIVGWMLEDWKRRDFNFFRETQRENFEENKLEVPKPMLFLNVNLAPEIVRAYLKETEPERFNTPTEQQAESGPAQLPVSNEAVSETTPEVTDEPR
jgi:hypothetical protein